MNNKIADLFLSWLYPDDGRCAICGVSASTNPLCPVCASEAYSFAATCQKMKLKSIHSVYALMPYEAELKHLLHELKYGNKPRIARKLALAIGQCLREKVLQYDCLTYVPMHKERYLVRGYNQAELLADEVSKLTGVKKETLIARVKKTPPQHLLTKIDRQKNVSQAFAAVGD
ncbi:MAG: hypothetical protein Q8N36_00910, partial [bacterium]|nr:hypothetical protein [bacterium]